MTVRSSRTTSTSSALVRTTNVNQGVPVGRLVKCRLPGVSMTRQKTPATKRVKQDLWSEAPWSESMHTVQKLALQLREADISSQIPIHDSVPSPRQLPPDIPGRHQREHCGNEHHALDRHVDEGVAATSTVANSLVNAEGRSRDAHERAR